MNLVRRTGTGWGGMLVIAEMTFRDAIRQRLFAGLLLFAGAFMFAAQALSDFNFGTTGARFILDFGLAAQGLFGAMLVISLTLHLFLAELEQGDVRTLLAKPLARSSYLAGKWLGIAGLVGIFCIFTTALLAGVLLGAGEAGIPWIGLAFAGLAQWFKFLILTSIVLLLSVICRTVILAGLLSLVVLALCHLHAVMARPSEAGLSAFVLAAGAWLPDFQHFDLSERVGSGGIIGVRLMATLGAYALAYSAVLLTLAIHGFRKRDL